MAMLRIFFNCLFRWGGGQSAPSPYIMGRCAKAGGKGYGVKEGQGLWLLGLVSLGRTPVADRRLLKPAASQ